MIYGDGSKPWYLVNPKIAGKWMFIPLKCIYRYWPISILAWLVSIHYCHLLIRLLMEIVTSTAISLPLGNLTLPGPGKYCCHAPCLTKDISDYIPLLDWFKHVWNLFQLSTFNPLRSLQCLVCENTLKSTPIQSYWLRYINPLYQPRLVQPRMCGLVSLMQEYVALNWGIYSRYYEPTIIKRCFQGI